MLIVEHRQLSSEDRNSNTSYQRRSTKSRNWSGRQASSKLREADAPPGPEAGIGVMFEEDVNTKAEVHGEFAE